MLSRSANPGLTVLAVFQEHGTTIHDYLFNYLWKNHGIRLDCVPIESLDFDVVGRYDLVLNAVCNDASQVERLHRLDRACDAASVRLLNRYEALLNCRRTRAARLWAEHGVQCARVERVPRREVLLRSELRYPLILRNEYAHLGSTMRLVHDRIEAETLSPDLFRGSMIAIEFHDFRSDDGWYRKYRCALLGDQVVPRHMISSRDWNIHSGSRQPERMAEHRAEEEEFWARDTAEADALRHARRVVGLDYAIVDYALDAHGTPFIFELNPCYSMVDPRAFQREWAYQLDAIHRYCEAFAALLWQARPLLVRDYLVLPVVL